MDTETLGTLIVVLAAPPTVVGGVLTCRTDRRLQARGWLLMAASFTLLLVAEVMEGDTLWASIAAGGLAVSLSNWWNSGGGDGMRRRLKSWARSLAPKTRPQTA
jgi:hypothetical protein